MIGEILVIFLLVLIHTLFFIFVYIKNIEALTLT